ncbi:MAG TPA: class I SAM-dependent methyltransferase [Candidatus Dormibacteraeota bacterium]|nr:class I SAM-dependent methyltransferase [Candidatus Dormibacteraeota bacterium]
MDDASLSRAWERAADQWAAWARKPGHDSYWRFHKAPFFALLPPPGRLTLDIGCGEGRVSRDLQALGHNVVGIDVSPTLVSLARTADPSMRFLVADAARLPLDDGVADLAVAFMSLQDVDDMPAAIGEIGRTLQPGGVACLAIVHPINSAGQFEGIEPGARFVIAGSYLEPHIYEETIERDGLAMSFNSRHWPLEAYFTAMERAGLAVDALKEPTVDPGSIAQSPERARWRRIPLFLDLRAHKR